MDHHYDHHPPIQRQRQRQRRRYLGRLLSVLPVLLVVTIELQSYYDTGLGCTIQLQRLPVLPTVSATTTTTTTLTTNRYNSSSHESSSSSFLWSSVSKDLFGSSSLSLFSISVPNTTTTTINNTTNTTTTNTTTNETTVMDDETDDDSDDDNEDDEEEIYCGYNYLYRFLHHYDDYFENDNNDTTIIPTKVPKPTSDELQQFYVQYIQTIQFTPPTTTTTTTTNRMNHTNHSQPQLYDNDELRKIRVYIYFANLPLPDPNVTNDDYESIFPNETMTENNNNNNNTTMEENDPLVMYQRTNPQFNSRNDVRQFVARTISRMQLQCPLSTTTTITTNTTTTNATNTTTTIITTATTTTNDFDTIFLHPWTKPFSAPGTSARAARTTDAENNDDAGRMMVFPNSDITIQCHRDGDYDFALMDLLLLAYTLRNEQDRQQQQQEEEEANTTSTSNNTTTGSNSGHTIISPEAQYVLENVLLSVGLTGKIVDSQTTSYVLPCRIKNIPFFLFNRQRTINIYLQIDDTENHTLMSHVAKYLINQLYYTYYPNIRADPTNYYNNDKNGNTEQLLRHLSAFLLQSQFYEYNSKPYQGSTMVAINLLHTFTIDPNLRIATQNILDMITVYNTVQSDRLRRFVPFRRQPQYVSVPQSWAGDGEYQRLSILLGNHQNVLPEIGRTECIMTTQSTYKIDPIIVDLFYPTSTYPTNNNNTETNHTETMTRQKEKEEETTQAVTIPHYFVGNTQVAEIYASTEKVLLSGGGHSTPSDIGNRRITPIQRPLYHRFNIRLRYIYNTYIVNFLLSLITDDERGWSRPTTIIPRSIFTNDYHITDMIRFVGHRDISEGAKLQNLCVAPNFVCGLQLNYGDRIGTDAIMNNCSVTIGEWKFLNLYHSNETDNNDDDDDDNVKYDTTICPNYGFYMAVYERLCDLERCMDKADRYGLIEIMEPNTITNHTNNIDFATFQEQIMNNNPMEFPSQGIRTYTTIDQHTIQFEIDPIDGQSSIVQYNTVQYERNYKNWPIARSRTIQSTTPGRLTIDNERYNNQRLILDMTIPTNPRRYTTTIPILRYSESTVGISGRRLFDDGTSIVPENGITQVTFYTNLFFQLVGYRMEWGSGMSVTHGSTGTFHNTHSIDEANESIVIMTIGTSWLWGSNTINYIQMQTNDGRRISSGYFGQNKVSFISKPTENICALYGRADDNGIGQLGAIYTPNRKSDE